MSKEPLTIDYAAIMKLPIGIFGTLLLILGICLLVAPETTLSVTNDPTMGQVGLFRFLGAWMLAGGIACWSTGENPDRQHPVLMMSALGCGLGAGALVFVWTGLEYRGDDWIIITAIALLAFFGAIFWWGQTKIGGELEQANSEIKRFADEYFGRAPEARGRRTLGRRKTA